MLIPATKIATGTKSRPYPSNKPKAAPLLKYRVKFRTPSQTSIVSPTVNSARIKYFDS